jgi:thiol-disulfide isomerase/thioredoxin
VDFPITWIGSRAKPSLYERRGNCNEGPHSARRHEDGGQAVNRALVFAGIALLAVLAGTALWLGARPNAPHSAPAGISPGALYAASFVGRDGKPQVLGQFQGRVIVLNFWATWCAPCREEMPGFARLQGRWGPRGVQFVGLALDDAQKVARFGDELRINYPLWTGDEAVNDLSRRLGNRLGLLPQTAIVDASGTVVTTRMGVFDEAKLDELLAQIVTKTR